MTKKNKKKSRRKAGSKKKAPKATNRGASDAVTKRRGGPRLPFPPSLARKLGFECEDLASADIALHNDRPRLRKALAEYLEKYPVLKDAYERGRLLRNLKGCAETMTVSQAAKWLGFGNGYELRAVLDSDGEARNIWEQRQLDTIVTGKRNVLGLLDKGDAKALRLFELFLKDNQQVTAAAADLEHLGMNQVADLFGYSRQAVNEWYTSKGLPRNGDNTFDLKTTIKWFEDYCIRKAARGRGAVGPLNPFQQVKTEREKLKLAEDRGELLDRGAVIGWQVAQLQNVMNAFDKIADYANLMYGQSREQIVEQLEEIRDIVLARLQNVPERLKLSDGAESALMKLYEAITKKNEKGK